MDYSLLSLDILLCFVILSEFYSLATYKTKQCFTLKLKFTELLSDLCLSEGHIKSEYKTSKEPSCITDYIIRTPNSTNRVHVG